MFRLLGKYLKKHIIELVTVLIFVGIQVVFQTYFFMGQMKDVVLDQGVAQGNMTIVREGVFRMMVYTILAIACTFVTSFVSARIVASVICEIRRDCMDRIFSLTPQEFAGFGASSLITRVMSDNAQLQLLLINMSRSSLMVPFIILSMLVLIFMINVPLAVLLFVAFLITVLIMIILGNKSHPFFERVQGHIDRINLLVREKLTGARTIRAFRNQEFEKKKMEEADLEVFREGIEANRRINFLSPLSLIIMNWTVVGIYLIGINQVETGTVSVSDLLLIFTYLTYFIASLAVVPVLVNLVPKVTVSAKRVSEILEYKSPFTGVAGKATDGIKRGEIEFRSVIFGYDGAAEVIANVSFRADAGKTTAIIGATGSGKTTLLNLLQGLYAMNFGEILIDGKDIRSFNPEYLQSNISYATQHPLVFQDTVINNIRCYDPSISDERVQAAVKASGFSDVIDKLPDGPDTVMAQDGMNISGGQRQRLSLARTLAKDCPIYVFDDSFSALDTKTEKHVRSSIQELLQGRTIILVSQKIVNVKDADKIIVLEKGHIVAEGKHEELLNSCDQYREIYEIQCSSEDS